MYQYRRLTAGAVALIGVMLVSSPPARAQAPADNTKVNQRDRANDAPTADQQKENASDRDLTQKIRRSVMNDKTLSTYAHNVKIIAQDGQVTLKGPVRTEAEKKSIEAKAIAVAGADRVVNEISIAPSKK